MKKHLYLLPLSATYWLLLSTHTVMESDYPWVGWVMLAVAGALGGVALSVHHEARKED